MIKAFLLVQIISLDASGNYLITNQPDFQMMSQEQCFVARKSRQETVDAMLERLKKSAEPGVTYVYAKATCESIGDSEFGELVRTYTLPIN